MNKSDLEDLMKREWVPSRSDEYWEQFPKRVTTKTHWQPQPTGMPSPEWPRRLSPAALLKGFGLACACIVVGLAIGFWEGPLPDDTVLQLAEARKCLNEIESLFPNQLRAIVFDEEGARLVLAEKANAPNSPAVFLKVCGPRGCQSFITFSGQQIRINGDECDVLVDGEGNVLLAGRQLVWSSAAFHRTGKYHIEARALKTSS